VLAVFLSRTAFSPLGPYVGYLSGALRFHWAAFSLAAVLGAGCWSLAYSYLGYAFATQIGQLARLIGNTVGIMLAGAVALGIGWYLIRSFRAWRGGSLKTENKPVQIVP